jgi:hypothetical protein
MVDWNPLHYVGWKTTAAVAAAGAAKHAYDTADIWTVILKDMIRQGLADLGAWTANKVLPTEETMIEYLTDNFDSVFDTTEKLLNPLETLETVVNTTKYLLIGMSIGVGMGSEYYVERKKWSFTRGSIYTMAVYGFLVGSLQAEALSAGVGATIDVVGKIEPTHIASVRTTLISTIKGLGLPQENPHDKL